MAHNYIIGLFKDEEVLLDAVKKIRAEGIKIYDVLTPFPVHGLEHAMGLKESKLHIAGFVYGITGTTCALSFMSWVFTSNWPMIYGGKPFFSFPAFIPITFEFTVLCAGIGMTLTFLLRCGLYPGRIREKLDDRITDDTFCIVFNKDKKMTADQISKINSILQSSGAYEIKERSLQRHY
jgi:hypothetical protein